MRTEIKFLIPNENILNCLLDINKLEDFQLGEIKKIQFKDVYLDSTDMWIKSQNYSLRCRYRDENTTYILRSLSTNNNYIFNIEEIKNPFNLYENSILKSFLFGIDTNSLLNLFEVDHIRYIRSIRHQDKLCAEINIEKIKINSKGKKLKYLQLEIKIFENQGRENTKELIKILNDKFKLKSENLSEFENGMNLLFATNTNNADKNITPVSIEELFNKYNVERKHARKVTENVLMIFDSLQPIHKMKKEYRNVIWITALMHDIGVNTYSEKHNKMGRDILLTEPVKEMDSNYWFLAPWIVYFHNKKITIKKLEKFYNKVTETLSLEMQQDTLKLAALLRIADGLDYSRMNSKIKKIIIDGNKVIIYVSGHGVQIDLKRAEIKSDLWNLIYDCPLVFNIIN